MLRFPHFVQECPVCGRPLEIQLELLDPAHVVAAFLLALQLRKPAFRQARVQLGERSA